MGLRDKIVRDSVKGMFRHFLSRLNREILGMRSWCPLLLELAPALVCSGLKVINLATELIAEDFCHPPSVFSFVPKRGSLASAVWCRVLWCAHFVSFYTRDWCWKALSTLYIGWRLPRALRRQSAAIRKASGLRGRFAEYGGRYRLPGIILCSEAFNFPRYAGRTRLYASAALHYANTPRMIWANPSPTMPPMAIPTTPGMPTSLHNAR